MPNRSYYPTVNAALDSNKKAYCLAYSEPKNASAVKTALRAIDDADNHANFLDAVNEYGKVGQSFLQTLVSRHKDSVKVAASAAKLPKVPDEPLALSKSERKALGKVESKSLDKADKALAKAKKDYEAKLEAKAKANKVKVLDCELKDIFDSVHTAVMDDFKRNISLTNASYRLLEFGLLPRPNVYDNFVGKKLGGFRVSVDITLDKKILDLAQRGEEGIKLAEFVDAIHAAVKPMRTRAAAAVAKLDKEMEKLSESEQKSEQAELFKNLKLECDKAAGVVAGAVKTVWSRDVAGKKALKEYRVKCATTIASGAVIATAAILREIATAGTDVAGYYSGLKALATVVGGIIALATGAKGFAEEVEDHVGDLRKRVKEGKAKSKNSSAKELAAILGTPFVTTVVSTKVAINNLLGTSSKLGSKAQKLLGVFETLQSRLEPLERKAKNPDVKKQLKKLGTQSSKLLEQIVTLNGSHHAHLELAADAKKAVDAYEKATDYKFTSVASNYAVVEASNTASDTLKAMTAIAKALALAV